MPKRNVDAVLDELDKLGARLEDVNTERDELYRQRDELIVEARERFEQPVTLGRIADAAHMSEQALTAARAKIGERRGAKVR